MIVEKTPPGNGDEAFEAAREAAEKDAKMQRARERHEIKELFGDGAIESMAELHAGFGAAMRNEAKIIQAGKGSTEQKKEMLRDRLDAYGAFIDGLARSSRPDRSMITSESKLREDGLRGVAAALGAKDAKITEQHREQAQSLLNHLKRLSGVDCG